MQRLEEAGWAARRAYGPSEKGRRGPARQRAGQRRDEASELLLLVFEDRNSSRFKR